MSRIPRWVAAATVFNLALLAACGDDDDSNETTDEDVEETTTTTEEEAAEAAPSGDVPSAELTAPGTQLAIGESANIPVGYSDEPGVVAVTVDGIEAGSADDRATLGVEDDQPGDLFYLTMTVENVGSPEDLGSFMPGRTEMFALTSDGEPATPVAKFSAFAPCENEDPSELAIGETVTTCEIFLAPSGSEVTSAAFAAAYDDEPIVWS
jgi:hypothetical protein